MRSQEIDYILSSLLETQEDVSDINITVDKPFQVETSGILKPGNFNPPIPRLTPYQAEVFALNLVRGDRRLIYSLLAEGSCDLSYHLPGKARFRVNIFSQKGCYSTVMRRLASGVPSIAELNLPPAFSRIAQERNGIILVTGATGTGKTTSLAAVLNEINQRDSVHVVTLEDPVEYVHPQKKATFNQRELGVDFDSFASGLRAALRQAPKVILVGEMRDRETVEIGLSAAETGHLVLSTLHTVDAGQTIYRILGMFDQQEERQMKIRLAETLRWIVCQRLLPQIGGGRVAAFEIMGTNLRVRDAVLHGESEGKTFYDIIEAGQPFGMMTFDQSICTLFAQGLISEETALSYASRRSVVGRALDAIKARKGESTTPIQELELDKDYGQRERGKKLYEALLWKSSAKDVEHD